jgi:hypothetical protein
MTNFNTAKALGLTILPEVLVATAKDAAHVRKISSMFGFSESSQEDATCGSRLWRRGLSEVISAGGWSQLGMMWRL